jgi:hypothetical protein
MTRFWVGQKSVVDMIFGGLVYGDDSHEIRVESSISPSQSFASGNDLCVIRFKLNLTYIAEECAYH